MNEHDLLESMNEIEEELLERSERNKSMKEERKKSGIFHKGNGCKQKSAAPYMKYLWKRCVAAVVTFVIISGAMFWVQTNQDMFGNNSDGSSGNSNWNMTEVHALAVPEYPEMASCPEEDDYWNPSTGGFDSQRFSEDYDAWRESVSALSQEEGYAEPLTGYFEKTIASFLSGNQGENSAYSPVNVFLALSMLTELTDGNSRKQILDLIGVEDLENLRTLANAVWTSHYRDDGATTCVFASSLWMNQDISFVEETINNLAEYYYASSYQGQMGSEEYNNAFRGWLNEQTGGLLENEIQELKFDPDTILALATTIYYQASWSSEFNEKATQPRIFHGVDGDVEKDFMYKSSMTSYYWGEKFSAIGLALENGEGTMWLLLPDEGITPEELAEDEEAIDFLLSNGNWEQEKWVSVNIHLPKFDITSQMELSDELKKLGITDVFNSRKSDFSPITGQQDESFLSQVQHDVRVKIDEDGVTATGYTVALRSGASMPEDEVDFVLDRPFLFGVVSKDDLPLFVGIVNQPE